MMAFMELDRGPVRLFHPLLILVVLSVSAFHVCAQDADKRIEEIRQHDRKVNEQIAESESTVEGTGVYCNELVINKRDKSWPAVGIYKVVSKFYYTFGDREKDPYPNRLLKVTVTINRSDRHEYAEYLFNPAGQLIFYFEKDDEGPQAERRYYFASQRLVRLLKGQRTANSKSREALRAVSVILNEQKKLTEIFVKSLRD